MKRLILRFRTKDKANFNLIRRYVKTIETRAATEKYKNIRAGDVLRIVCGKEALVRRVKRARYFKNIASMLRVIPYRKIFPLLESVSGVEKIYFGYHGYRGKIRKFGLVALELE
jgi:ASC-1-like (ASCH) protein